MCLAVMMEPVSEGRTGPCPGDLRANDADQYKDLRTPND